VNTEIIVALMGLVSFILGYFFNKRKNDAEIEKLQAETEILRAKLRNHQTTPASEQDSSDEIILYDGRRNFRAMILLVTLTTPFNKG